MKLYSHSLVYLLRNMVGTGMLRLYVVFTSEYVHIAIKWHLAMNLATEVSPCDQKLYDKTYVAG